MQWSIRNQILIPLVLIQVVAVTATALTTAALAARRSEREVVDRLNGVIAALGHASFPYTAAVLAKMRGLSGAHFVAISGDGRVAETSLPGLSELPAALRSVPSVARIDSLGSAPSVVVDRTRFRAVTIRPSGDPRGLSLLVLYPETSRRQARDEAVLPPVLLGFGSLVAMAAVTGWVAHQTGVRIRKIRQHVAQIAEGHFLDLDPGRRRDEVGDLTRSINRMCAQLRDMQTTIRRTERARLLAQLGAGLAHQLRNSLTGARMSVQLHAKRCPARGGDESLDVALRQLAMTEEHVKGMLSLGRVERRPPEVVDLRGLLADVALLVQPSCRHAKVTLRHEAVGSPLEVLVDPSGVRAAVLNLTLNAIDAAGPGGFVGLSVTGGEDEWTIEVADNGPGPPPELGDQLYEAFVTSKPEGVGLGLALAQQVATEHGGALSWTRGDGTTRFRLRLPRPVVVIPEEAEWAAS